MKNVLNNGTKMVCFYYTKTSTLGHRNLLHTENPVVADFSQRTFKQVSYRSAFKKIGDHTSLSALKMKKDRRSQLSLQTFFFNYMNQLNKFLQDSRKNISDLQWLLIFKRKQNLWKNHVAKGNPAVWAESEEGCQQVSSVTENVDGEGQHEKNQTVFSFLSNEKVCLAEGLFLSLVRLLIYGAQVHPPGVRVTKK